MTTSNPTPRNIPLEDDPCDVLGKVMRAMGLTAQDISDRAQISADAVHAALEGQLHEDTILAMAKVLDIDGSALLRLPNYRPSAALPTAFRIFTSPFGHAGVNAFVWIRGDECFLFDTGTDVSEVLTWVEANQLTISRVLITHSHPDHVAGLDRLLENSPPPLVIRAEDVADGDVILDDRFGKLSVFLLDGHYSPARGYLIEHEQGAVCIVGDSIFAGSMGGCANATAFRSALDSARAMLNAIPNETILCPGHGPLTTAAQEVSNNPFLASC